MFSTVRRLTQLDWSPFLEETGANFNEDGPLQMTNPDPDGVAPMTNLYDRSFKEHNMSATWNGSMSANPVDRSQVIHLSVVSRRNISKRALCTQVLRGRCFVFVLVVTTRCWLSSQEGQHKTKLTLRNTQTGT